MTARELYAVEPALHGFLVQWEIDRRCPFALEDWFRDRDMHPQADAAKWLHEQPERKVWAPIRPIERDGECGAFPAMSPFNEYKTVPGWYWFVCNRSEHAHFIPFDFGDGISPVRCTGHMPLHDALLWPLDNYQPAPVEVT